MTMGLPKNERLAQRRYQLAQDFLGYVKDWEQDREDKKLQAISAKTYCSSCVARSDLRHLNRFATIRS